MVERKDGITTVTVSADPKGDYDKNEKCRLHEVKEYLREKNITVGACLTDDILTNTNPKKVMGMWRFEDLSFKPKKKKTKAKPPKMVEHTDVAEDMSKATLFKVEKDDPML